MHVVAKTLKKLNFYLNFSKASDDYISVPCYHIFCTAIICFAHPRFLKGKKNKLTINVAGLDAIEFDLTLKKHLFKAFLTTDIFRNVLIIIQKICKTCFSIII